MRRKNKKPPQIITPCKGVCKIVNKACIGCKRTQQEISEWFWMEDKIKLKIIESLKKR